MTRGRRLLIALLQITPGAYVAARLRVHHQRVADWASGYRNPSSAARLQLQANYGIAAADWDKPLFDRLGRRARS
jgi:hypothetical protein